MHDDILKQILHSQVEIKEDLNDIKLESVEIKKDLNYHIKRTGILEKHVDTFESRISKDLEPLKEHLSFLKNLAKLIKFGLVIFGSYLAYLKFME